MAKRSGYNQEAIVRIKRIRHHLDNTRVLIIRACLEFRVSVTRDLICYGNNMALLVTEPESTRQLRCHLRSDKVSVSCVRQTPSWLRYATSTMGSRNERHQDEMANTRAAEVPTRAPD